MSGAPVPMLRLRDAAALLPGACVVGDPNVVFCRVHTDTRTLRQGDLFVALKGERFDAHDFLDAARVSGAVAALASHGIAEAGLPGLQVDDPLAALQALASAWRQRFTLPLVAVTGSNGKTTVTQMVAAILRAAHGGASLATAGNLNNHIGVPLTVLGLESGHRAAVVELGMNHPGEIAELAAIARPTVALVNNAQREHQEFMQSVEAVARENGAVIAALPADGTAVFPADEEWAPLWRTLAAGRRTLTFALDGDGAGGRAAAADVHAGARWRVDDWDVRLHTPVGRVDFPLHIAGRHNVKNAAAAAACALAAGIGLQDIVQGLAHFSPVKGRSQVRPLLVRGQPRTLVDDTYNANPDSVRAAIDVLAELPRPRWLLMGDMGEVGAQGPAFHAEVGRHAQAAGIETVWCVGALMRHAALPDGVATGARHFDSVDDLLAALAEDEAPPFSSVLVKGSRFMRMERVVQALQAQGQAGGGNPHAA
ncbi:UDP-N-acetylmuramoyl-tripeptide--D-alanyl-D-alanine ligase [Ideonella sp.]|uniref:UDP-N-acetylmuramoyl-tripeptide--D-alanyl-D- alanine ligase n=1 Tax=Ideonella sp. TaxID=1929293 RepID=UPI0035B0823E